MMLINQTVQILKTNLNNLYMSTWKEVLCRQVSTLKFWENLFINSKFELINRLFLDRSDVMGIIKKAQSEVYENIIEKIKDRVDEKILSEIKKDFEDHLNFDTSAIGMFHNDKQITEGSVMD